MNTLNNNDAICFQCDTQTSNIGTVIKRLKRALEFSSVDRIDNFDKFYLYIIIMVLQFKSYLYMIQIEFFTYVKFTHVHI